ncbi:hypothetical protein EW146_g6385 [Bondarzewia mesenterica]|uniref:Terpene synthase n=1 Tax=Bondarzewia mesenterica TaxID=1095465 RepID=A0A4V3XEK2_9AGAM|nr:hypothetical protein EW146_g6385 [Bondarzewia mesenterica]
MSHADSDVLIIPDFISYCQYPVRSNPHGQGVASASENWLLAGAHLSAKKRHAFLGLKAGSLAAMCYPDSDKDRLRVCADYMNYLFKLDDWSDEFDAEDIGSMQDCVMSALRDPKGFETDKAVGKLAKCFFGRFVADGGPGCTQRFIDTMVLFFCAVTEQALHRIHEDIPDLESYLTLRRDTSGCKPCFALIEYAAGIDLPDAVLNHPSVQFLEDAANDLVTWTNDIFSYNVEQARGDTHNLVIVAMNERGYSIQEAINFVGDLCKDTIDSFNSVRRSLPSWGPEIDRQVEQYVDGLQNWIIGSLHWSFETKRYFGDRGQDVKKNLAVKLLPKKTQNSVQKPSISITLLHPLLRFLSGIMLITLLSYTINCLFFPSFSCIVNTVSPRLAFV